MLGLGLGNKADGMLTPQRVCFLSTAGKLKRRGRPEHSEVCVPSRFSRVSLLATLWTVAHQAPLSMGFSRQRILEWVAISSSKGSS